MHFLRQANVLHIDKNILFVFHDLCVKCFDFWSHLLEG